MTDPSAPEQEVARIVDQLEREHDGDAWHGTPLRRILADVDDQQAAWRPYPGVQTIWELVLHMTGWKSEVRKRLDGAPAGEPLEGDWPVPSGSGPQAWRQALDGLEEAHRALVTAVSRVPATSLFAPTNDPRVRETGQGVSHYVLLHGLVQHDAYHAGQIALLKKAYAASGRPDPASQSASGRRPPVGNTP